MRHSMLLNSLNSVLPRNTTVISQLNKTQLLKLNKQG